MNNDKILCEIGDEISFNIGGKSQPAKFEDLEVESTLDRIYRIQFKRAPKSDYLDKAIEAIKDRPAIRLRFYGDYSENAIDWNKLLPVQELVIDLWHIESLKDVGKLTNLKLLGISKNITSKVSLSILEPLQNLEILYTSISNDIEMISDLKKLNALTLREIKNDNLDFLAPLHNLETLYLSLGSFRDFNALSKIDSLKKLGVHQVRGFNDETAENALASCKTIEALKLENLKYLTDLSFVEKMATLKYLYLESVKNLNSYDPILKSKSVETLVGYRCQPLDKSLSGLKRIKNVGLGDSYSKVEINNLLSSQYVNNLRIRTKQLRGEMDNIDNPFIN